MGQRSLSQRPEPERRAHRPSGRSTTPCSACGCHAAPNADDSTDLADRRGGRESRRLSATALMSDYGHALALELAVKHKQEGTRRQARGGTPQAGEEVGRSRLLDDRRVLALGRQHHRNHRDGDEGARRVRPERPAHPRRARLLPRHQARRPLGLDQGHRVRAVRALRLPRGRAGRPRRRGAREGERQRHRGTAK